MPKHGDKWWIGSIYTAREPDTERWSSIIGTMVPLRWDGTTVACSGEQVALVGVGTNKDKDLYARNLQALGYQEGCTKRLIG